MDPRRAPREFKPNRISEEQYVKGKAIKEEIGKVQYDHVEFFSLEHDKQSCQALYTTKTSKTHAHSEAYDEDDALSLETAYQIYTENILFIARYRGVHIMLQIVRLTGFSEGSYAPRFLVIDDGWQETYSEFCKAGEEQTEGTQFASRLRSMMENDKFQRLTSDGYSTLLEFIKFIKERYGLKYVYTWHAVVGYWGGFLPSSESLNKYNPKIVYPVQSPGNVGNLRDVAMDSIERYGLRAIDPEKISDFYDDYHSYLASIDVSGVKVDI